MVEEYLGVKEKITEGAGMSEFIVDVNGGEVVVNIIPPKTRSKLSLRVEDPIVQQWRVVWRPYPSTERSGRRWR